MTLVKGIGIAVVAYAALVVAFETWLGMSQPESGDTLVITTTDRLGNESERVLSAMETGGQLYVSANHWPRAWYANVLERPNVEVARGTETRPYVAVPIAGSERERVVAEHPHGLAFRILTGFPPRHFVRLDPADEAAAP